MRDPYTVLGIAKTASQADIKKAFRALAQKYHPDRHEGDKSAEERFKEVNAAYKLLSDEDLRQRYDRGAVDANGDPTFRSGWTNQTGRGQPHSTKDFNDMFRDFASGRTGSKTAEDIFSDIFSGGAGAAGARGAGAGNPFGDADAGPGGFARAKKGPTVNFWLELDFVEAATGIKKTVKLPTGKEVNVTIPPGAEDGQTLRLKGQGMPGLNKGPYGDALIELSIKPDAVFTRKGRDIHAELPVTVQEALLGAKVEAQTVDGTVQITVPKGSNSGTTLRLKGKGVKEGDKRGDQYVKLKVMLPNDDDEFTEFVERWSKRNDYQVRPKGR